MPSVDWLHALQSATAPHVLKANEANAAELIWAVAKLAKAASTTDSTSTVAHSLLLPQWRVAFEQRVGAQRPGVGEAYGLVDLARLLWAAATLQARPRPGLLNSFAGRCLHSQGKQRLPFSCDPACVLDRNSFYRMAFCLLGKSAHQ